MNNKIKNRVRATLLEMSNYKKQNNLMIKLNNLLEELENKIDPSQNELFIIENIYRVQENLNLLKENLEKYNKGKSIVTVGSKLSDLFEKSYPNKYF